MRFPAWASAPDSIAGDAQSEPSLIRTRERVRLPPSAWWCAASAAQSLRIQGARTQGSSTGPARRRRFEHEWTRHRVGVQVLGDPFTGGSSGAERSFREAEAAGAKPAPPIFSFSSIVRASGC